MNPITVHLITAALGAVIFGICFRMIQNRTLNPVRAMSVISRGTVIADYDQGYGAGRLKRIKRIYRIEATGE